jgi:hypothetical protein
VGITPRQAVAIRTPWTARLLGWPEPESGVAPVADWAGAEAATDRTMAQVFSCLESAERGELADLLDALLARTGALWTDVPGSPATVPARTSARHAE